MARIRIGLALGIAVALGMGIVACSDDEPADAGLDAADASGDGGKKDDGSSDTGPEDAAPAETGPKDGGKDADADTDADADAGPTPGLVTDFAGTAETHTAVKLTWTAPLDYTGSGAVARYDIRWSTTPITTDAEFFAGTEVATPPAPQAPGGAETTTIEGLTPETQYYVALRAQYDNDGYGPRSQTVIVTTKARAKFLVAEIAPHNAAASGGDFVELVATTAGFAGGLTVSSGYASPLYAFAPFDVQVGDRIVVHASGLPGPTGYAQEDAAKSKTVSTSTYASANAYDVYSDSSNLPDTMGTIVVAEPGDILAEMGLIQDMGPYSDRSQTDTPDTLTLEEKFAMFAVFAGIQTNEWPTTFTLDELETLESVCEVSVDLLNASENATPACGGAAGTLTDGRSFQRTGTTDTNSSADFTVAPQTRGAAN
jgi:hypothetical protein